MPEISAKHVFILLAVFWALWVYGQWVERVERIEFKKTFEEFHDLGPRNTATQGYELCLRVARIEAETLGLEPPDCEKLYAMKGHHHE